MSQSQSNPVIAITGHRELLDGAAEEIEWTIAEELSDHWPSEIRFGGALGTDTEALIAACNMRVEGAPGPKLHVIVPFKAKNMPEQARRWATECADVITELDLAKSKKAYLERNLALLEGADRLVAFTDGRQTGGTAHTIREAARRHIPTRIVSLPDGLHHNPELDVEALAPIHAVYPYVSEGVRDRRGLAKFSQIIRDLKAELAHPSEIEQLAKLLFDYAQRLFPDACYFVPMPRRIPGVPSDLIPLTRAMARHSEDCFSLESWLVRTAEPQDGYVAHWRQRYPSESHAASMEIVEQPELAEKALLIDNVVTTAGTSVGAQMAVARDTGFDVPLLSMLYSKNAVGLK